MRLPFFCPGRAAVLGRRPAESGRPLAPDFVQHRIIWMLLGARLCAAHRFNLGRSFPKLFRRDRASQRRCGGMEEWRSSWLKKGPVDPPKEGIRVGLTAMQKTLLCFSHERGNISCLRHRCAIFRKRAVRSCKCKRCHICTESNGALIFCTNETRVPMFCARQLWGPPGGAVLQASRSIL